MKRRHSSTTRIMKILYPNKRMSLTELKLSADDITALKQDIKLFGGINVSYRREDEIECIWLSSNGKKTLSKTICREMQLRI